MQHSEETQQAFLLCLVRVESLVGQTKGSGYRSQQMGIHIPRRCLNRVGELSGHLLLRGAEPSPVPLTSLPRLPNPGPGEFFLRYLEDVVGWKRELSFKEAAGPLQSSCYPSWVIHTSQIFPRTWEPVTHRFPRNSESLVLKWKQCLLPSGRHSVLSC